LFGFVDLGTIDRGAGVCSMDEELFLGTMHRMERGNSLVLLALQFFETEVGYRYLNVN
jgi:hypothetical protein